jgi:hypothetical protein
VPLRKLVFLRDQGRCRYCRLAQFGQGAVFHINHVTPRSRGGATAESNLVLQCPWCSLHKSNNLTGVDPVTGESTPLFHPLQQNWNDHFKMTSAGVCEGRTPTGRATVPALAMNETLPQIARSIQIQLKLLSLS